VDRKIPYGHSVYLHKSQIPSTKFQTNDKSKTTTKDSNYGVDREELAEVDWSLRIGHSLDIGRWELDTAPWRQFAIRDELAPFGILPLD
jgi:hypothetical protein